MWTFCNEKACKLPIWDCIEVTMMKTELQLFVTDVHQVFSVQAHIPSLLPHCGMDPVVYPVLS